ncbi:hypothetical protein DHEL01_v205248 [Diaporthe helianthi]|uniref:Uncharacterized protein n=1 Tax=Diaporthe helianthi TaxID=158607 RepID=A0A2P5I1G9_DIAHE|nr:hypothetical protein DHEL01_v205248 [Diaporthe helianthi]
MKPPPKNPDLERILKFCATTTTTTTTNPPKSAPSPPLSRGEVYCLSSFARRAEQWYKEEAGRQLTQRGREAAAAAVGRSRRQPSRAAKGTLEPGDYVLRQDEVDALLLPPGATSVSASAARPRDREKGNSRRNALEHEMRCRWPATPPADGDVDGDADSESEGESEPPDQPSTQSPEARLRDFVARLRKAIHTKDQELRARHDSEGGIRHTCAAGGAGWDCVDSVYCGHGLVDRCVAWVPRAKAHLRARVRFEMEGFFSSSASNLSLSHDHDCLHIVGTRTNNNSPERLAELKKGRAAALRAETMRRMADIEARLESGGGAAAVEAEMLESPTLGRWPVESRGFPREDVGAQKVELAGLVFAVDVCIGETRVLML